MLKRTGLFALLGVIAFAQQASPPVTFRTGTQLVQVSVIAQDAAGKPVTDLRREDFQIFDNGTAQQLQLFLASNPLPGLNEAIAPGAFSNKLGPGGSGYSVLLFDNLNMDPGSNVFAQTARARLKALQALESIPAGDRIAIYALWCKFQVIREFTSDRDSLRQQLEAFAPGASLCVDPGSGEGPARMSVAQMQQMGPMRPDGSPGVGMINHMPPSSAPPAPGGHGAAGAADAAAGIVAGISDQEMKAMAEHLAGIPGRKNLIWLTSTFYVNPANLRRLINANVALYPVDTIGSTIALKRDKELHAAPIRALAAQTGGLAYVDRDDFDAAISEALNDGRVSYTLGYYPAEDNNKAAIHQVRVSVNRPGVMLRYRTSYTIEPQAPASADPVRDLIQAMNRPVNATEIPITATVARRENQLDLSASFNIEGLNLQWTGELWKGNAEVISRFSTAEGIATGNTVAETMIFTLKPATYTSMLEKGALYHKELAIPVNAVELDLLVGSLATGKIGTLKIPLSEVGAAPAK